MICARSAHDAVGASGNAYFITPFQGVQDKPFGGAVGGMDLGQRFYFGGVVVQIGGAPAGVHIDQHLLVAQGVVKLGCPHQIGLGIGVLFGKKSARAPQPGFVVSVDDVAVAAVLGKGTPFAAQKGDEAAGFIKGLGLAPHLLPHVQSDVVVVALMGGELQGGDIAAMGVVGGD